MAIYTAVLRARSAAVVPIADTFGLGLGDGVTVLARTRWHQLDLEHQLPGDLWFEVVGPASDLDDATRKFGGVAQAVALAIAFVANAPVEQLETELVFESSPGVERRDFRQVFVPAESLRPRGGRLVSGERLKTFVDAYVAAGPTPRIQRAVHQYSLALRNWEIGSEYQCLSHLWIAAETLTNEFQRKMQGTDTFEAFGKRLGVPPRNGKMSNSDVLGKVRELAIFHGDNAVYSAAKDFSNGLEHGYLDLAEAQQVAVEIAFDAFGHVRRAILELLSLPADDTDWIASRHPRDVRSTRKVVQGAIVGQAAALTDLAAPNETYPHLAWTSKLSRFYRDGEEFKSDFTDNFRPVVAKGVVVTDLQLGIYGRRPLSTDPSTPPLVVKTIEASGLTVEVVDDALRAAKEAMRGQLDGVVTRSASDIAQAAMVANCLALFESIHELLKDRRAVESLALVARLFEWSMAVRYLASSDQPDNLAQAWFGAASHVQAEIDRWAEWADVPLPSVGTHGGDHTRLAEGLLPFVDEDWLREQADHLGARRLYWLWKVDQLVRATALSALSRSTDSDPPALTTRELQAEDLAEQAGAACLALACVHDATRALFHWDDAATEEIRAIGARLLAAVDEVRQSVAIRTAEPGVPTPAHE